MQNKQTLILSVTIVSLGIALFIGTAIAIFLINGFTIPIEMYIIAAITLALSLLTEHKIKEEEQIRESHIRYIRKRWLDGVPIPVLRGGFYFLITLPFVLIYLWFPVIELMYLGSLLTSALWGTFLGFFLPILGRMIKTARIEYSQNGRT